MTTGVAGGSVLARFGDKKTVSGTSAFRFLDARGLRATLFVPVAGAHTECCP